MNYAKVIGSAVQLFPKKIKVTLIDATTGTSLGKHKVPAELLPTAFNRPTTLVIDNTNWRVLHADPVLADDFLFTKKLTLQVQQAANLGAQQLKFNFPTVCSEWPITGVASLYHDFTLEMEKTDWRQIEFLSLRQADMVEEAVKEIESILTSQPNPLLGYEQQYIRNNALQPDLTIPFEDFCALLIDSVRGNIFFTDQGFVQSGFAVRSDSYTYYGMLENGLIQTLCLSQFDWADDELMCGTPFRLRRQRAMACSQASNKD